MLKEETWKVVTRADLRWVREVRLDREVVSGEEALNRAENEGLDLVLVNMHPFIGKILDYKKCLYDAKKKAKEQVKKQRENAQEVKEMSFRPSIGDADFSHKMKQIEEFIGEGDKVDVKIVLRGREAAGSNSYVDAFQGRLVEELSKVGKIIKQPVRNGKVIFMSVVKGDDR